MLCALPASAQANPSISVSSSAEGVPGNLPSKVTHRLALTAGATPETVAVSALGGLAVSGDSVTVSEQTAVGPALSRCGTRWERRHDAFGGLSRFRAVVTIAPGATAFVDTVRSFKNAPWADDSLDADWELTPAQGSAFDVASTAPVYEGAYGVELDFTLTRLSAGVYAVQGTALAGVNSGRVELWGYAPGKTRATRLPSRACATTRGRSRSCVPRAPAGGSSTRATGAPARPSRTTPRSAARSSASAEKDPRRDIDPASSANRLRYGEPLFQAAMVGASLRPGLPPKGQLRCPAFGGGSSR